MAKALEKEKTRRYASAGDLASDIRRYLGGDAILARKVRPAERSWRWARRNPLIAALAGVLATALACYGRVAAGCPPFRRAWPTARLTRLPARHGARKDAEAAGAAAQAETYRALLSEVNALRAGHQLGWREEALADLSRLVTMPTPRRNVFELRSEAVATIGEFGVNELVRLDLDFLEAAVYVAFSPDSKTLMTASEDRVLHLWDVPGRKHLRRLAGVPKFHRLRGRDDAHVEFLSDGDVAFLTPDQRVSFLGASGRQSARPQIERKNVKATDLAIDRHDRWLAVRWEDGQLDVVDSHTGALRRRLRANTGTYRDQPRWQVARSSG